MVIIEHWCMHVCRHENVTSFFKKSWYLNQIMPTSFILFPFLFLYFVVSAMQHLWRAQCIYQPKQCSAPCSMLFRSTRLGLNAAHEKNKLCRPSQKLHDETTTAIILCLFCYNMPARVSFGCFESRKDAQVKEHEFVSNPHKISVKGTQRT